MAQIKYIIILSLIIAVLSGCIGEKQTTPVPTPVSTPTITMIPTITVTPISEAAPTGNKTLIKLDKRRGFNPLIQTIRPGDEIIWNNREVDTITLVSEDGLFKDQILAYDQQYTQIFPRTGSYRFYLIHNKDLNGTIVVEYPKEVIQTGTPASIKPKELPLNSIFVSARMLKPSYWAADKYQLDSLNVDITSQKNEKFTIKAQIISDNQVLEERSFTLENSGSRVEFSNENKHLINSSNVTLKLLVNDYLPVEYACKIVDALN